jgi:hypothetical protein
MSCRKEVVWRLVASGLLALLAACGQGKTPAGQPGASSAVRRASGPDGITIVRAPGGRLHVVVNQHPTHMTLELDGAEIGVSEDDPGVWLVDGQVIHVAIVPPRAIYGTAPARVSDQQLLLDHMAWEAGYIEAELGMHVRARPQACRTARGTQCLFSNYDLEAARKNLLITTVVADQVVGLASLVPSTRDSSEAEARLRALLETIQPHEGWIDPAQEAARLGHSTTWARR